MTDTLEQELRTALAERASGMPDAFGAIGRLERVDYYPRRAPSRLRWLPAWLSPWPALGGAAAALAGGIVTAVLLLSSGAAPAYAGWTPVPSAPSAAALATIKTACKRQAGPLLRAAITGRLMLAEQRGRYIAALYSGGTDAGVCFSAGSGFAGGSGTGERFDDPPKPDQLGLWSEFSAPLPASLGSDVGVVQAAARQVLNSRFFKRRPVLRARARARIRAGQGYAGGIDVYGRAGSDITAVSFVVYRSLKVQATVENGWYFAWWPGAPWWPGRFATTSVSVTTRSGKTISSSMAGRTCAGKPDCVFAGFKTN
jgi:hypothetical protein